MFEYRQKKEGCDLFSLYYDITEEERMRYNDWGIGPFYHPDISDI